jgi:hypothetical protein
MLSQRPVQTYCKNVKSIWMTNKHTPVSSTSYNIAHAVFICIRYMDMDNIFSSYNAASSQAGQTKLGIIQKRLLVIWRNLSTIFGAPKSEENRSNIRDIDKNLKNGSSPE